MREELEADIANLTHEPGVYQYYDANGKLLYVGKARDLKKRVTTYFTNGPLGLRPNPRNSPRIQKMTSQIARINTLIVHDEKEALILENSFIKSQHPRYNVLLRDDKTYPYIYIDLNERYPRFDITRNVSATRERVLRGSRPITRSRSSRAGSRPKSITSPSGALDHGISIKCVGSHAGSQSRSEPRSSNVVFFGPYTRGASNILKSIYDIFPLVQQRQCPGGKKLCLYHQMDACLGVCVYELDEQYSQMVNEALALIRNPRKFIRVLRDKMHFFADREMFERAKDCRDSIMLLENTQAFSVVDTKMVLDIDVLSFHSMGNSSILFKLFVRDGKVVSSDHVLLKATGESILDVYTQAVLNLHRDGSDKDILLSNISKGDFNTLRDELSALGLTLLFPTRGAKARLAQLADKNALSTLESNIAACVGEDLVLNDIRSLFSIERDIECVEVFDTSHHSGSFCVGAMVCYSQGRFHKDLYRRYKLQEKDEISQMKELLTRRARSFVSIPPPSLWLIDGGKAQINIALEVLDSVHACVEVIAISKEKRSLGFGAAFAMNAVTHSLSGRSPHVSTNRSKGSARDTLRSKDLEFRLDPSDKRLQFLQRLRDEAHRFAILFHRERKLKSILG